MSARLLRNGEPDTLQRALEKIELEECDHLTTADRLWRELGLAYVERNYERTLELSILLRKHLDDFARSIAKRRTAVEDYTRAGTPPKPKGFDYTRYDDDHY